MEVTNSNKKPRAAVYLRKSTIDDRPSENRSFARQMADMSKIISEFEVVAEFQQKIGISASRFSDQERSEWDNALAGLGFDYDVLIGAQFDRLARRGISELVDIYAACEQGHGEGRVITAEWDSASSEARILGPIIAELARAESEKLHLRITGGKAVQKAKNDWLGGRAPWAWDITRDADGNAQYRIIPEHQAASIEAARRFIEGATYSDINFWAEEQGLKTQPGKRLCNESWRAIFLNPSMAGHRRMDGEIITDDIEEDVLDLEEVIEELERRIDEDIERQMGDLWWRMDVLTEVLRTRAWADELLDQHLGPQPGW